MDAQTLLDAATFHGWLAHVMVKAEQIYPLDKLPEARDAVLRAFLEGAEPAGTA